MILGEMKLPEMNGIEISPGIFIIGEPTPVAGTSRLRCLANVGGALCLVELAIKFPGRGAAMTAPPVEQSPLSREPIAVIAMIALPRQPDDPGIEFAANPYAPVVFGQRFAELDDATLRVIRKNAGRVPPLTLAQALCWRMKRLQKIALAHGIDLRFHNDEAEPRGA